jgi:hypothetical protein
MSVILTDEEEYDLNHMIESRDYGHARMRFDVDPDTTERLKRLQLDTETKIPRWRRILRRLKGESY